MYGVKKIDFFAKDESMSDYESWLLNASFKVKKEELGAVPKTWKTLFVALQISKNPCIADLIQLKGL